MDDQKNKATPPTYRRPLMLSPSVTSPGASFYRNRQISTSGQNFHSRYVGMNPIPPSWGSSSNHANHADNLTTPQFLPLGAYPSVPEAHQNHINPLFRFRASETPKLEHNTINSLLQGSGSNLEQNRINSILQLGSSPMLTDSNLVLGQSSSPNHEVEGRDVARDEGGKLSPDLTAACEMVGNEEVDKPNNDQLDQNDEKEDEEMESSDEDAKSNTGSPVRTWNLRPRKEAKQGQGGGRSRKSSTPMRVSKPRCAKSRGQVVPEKKEVVLTLTKEEIEHDFLLMTGEKPPKKPNKRPHKVQKTIENLYPGMHLSNITPELYGVNDDPPLKC